MIIEKQSQAVWGNKFLEQLSKDLRAEFPGTKGFSVSNLEKMRKFAFLYSDLIPAQAVRELPWGHIVVLMEHQYRITVGEDDYFLDMLFYNVYLSCYFVVEIKTTPVKPEYIGKLNFYLAVRIAQQINKSSDDQGFCLVRMQRVENLLVVEDNNACGGAMATFTGIYWKSNL